VRSILLFAAGLFFVTLAAAAPQLALRSPAFSANGEIPKRFTCDGENISPALLWGAPPAGTRSFALVVDDPDAPDPAAPRQRWVHLVVYNLPANARALPESVGNSASLPGDARFGANDWGKSSWNGPCPPIGRHRYVFTLYALDYVPGDRGALPRRSLESSMEGHILAQAELIGTYQRSK